MREGRLAADGGQLPAEGGTAYVGYAAARIGEVVMIEDVTVCACDRVPTENDGGTLEGVGEV